MKKIVAERVNHKGEARISLRFGYDETLIGIVKRIKSLLSESDDKCCEEILREGLQVGD